MPAAWIAAPLDQPCARTEDRINPASIGRWLVPVETTEERHGRKCIRWGGDRTRSAGLKVHHLNTGTPVKPAQPQDQPKPWRSTLLQEATARCHQTDAPTNGSTRAATPMFVPSTPSRSREWRRRALLIGPGEQRVDNPASAMLIERPARSPQTCRHRTGIRRTRVPVRHGTFCHIALTDLARPMSRP